MKKKLFVMLISIPVIAGICFLLMYLEKQRMSENTEVQIRGNAMGTVYNISIIVPIEEKQNLDSYSLKENIDQKILEIEEMASVFKDRSEISMVNRFKSTNWIEISYDMYFLIKKAKKVSSLTKGKYDVTIGNLIDLWRFGPTQARILEYGFKAKPSDSEIKKVQKTIGNDKVLLKEEGGKFYLKKLNKDLTLNLSSIAKGYGVDEVSKLLSNLSYNNHKVEIGGEVKTSGKNVNSKEFRIGIERPNLTTSNLQLIHLDNKSVATAGIYRNYRKFGEKLYPHLIDPVSGYPIDNKVISTTIIADECVDADALTTGFSAFYVDEGIAIAEEHHIPIYYIYLDEQGQVKEKWNKDFEEYMIPNGN